MNVVYNQMTLLVLCSSGSVGDSAYRSNIVPFVEQVIEHYAE